MAKHITGKTYRKEGRDRERLFTEITCSDCGAKTYERRKDRIQAALDRDCKSCKAIATADRKLQRQQDLALLKAHRSIFRLLPRPDRRLKHGCHRLCSRTAHIYAGMVRRCVNPNDASYEYYGGRGITVCDRWLESIKNFFDDMGPAPAGYSLERVDVNGNYEPENCKWIPLSDQSKNRRCSLANRGIDPDEYWRQYHKAWQQRNAERISAQRKARYVPTGRPRGRPRKTQKK